MREGVFLGKVSRNAPSCYFATKGCIVCISLFVMEIVPMDIGRQAPNKPKLCLSVPF